MRSRDVFRYIFTLLVICSIFLGWSTSLGTPTATTISTTTTTIRWDTGSLPTLATTTTNVLVSTAALSASTAIIATNIASSQLIPTAIALNTTASSNSMITTTVTTATLSNAIPTFSSVSPNVLPNTGSFQVQLLGSNLGSISVIIVNGTSISSISSASNVISITINATAFLPLSSNYSLSKLVPVTVAGTTWNLTIFQTTQQESFTQNQNSFARYLSSSVTQNIVVTWQNGVTLPPIANQAYCVFGTSSPSPVYASATMVNSTSFSCIVPPSCTSLGILSMILSYNRPSLSNNWSTLSSYAFGSVISLCIKDRAPQVVIAQFQNQANLLQIAFDMEVTAYNTTSLEPMSNIFQPVACSCYFDSSMVGIMWRDGQLQDCSAWFTVGSTMSVAMSPMVYTSNHSLAISSTTKVKLLDAVFYNKTSIFGMATSGAYSLSVPSLGTLLNANIVVPFIWTGCNDLPIDLSQMLNHYGRPIQNVTVTSTQTPSLALSTALNSIMSQIKTGSTLVYFPVSLFIPNTWLNITFGSMSTGFESYQNVTTSTYCPNFKGTYPAPAIISPSVSADVTRSTRLSIVDLGDCPFPNLPLVVNWSYVPSFLDNSFNISTCIGSTSSELTIPANSLLPGLYYTFQVAVSFQGFNARVFQAAFQTKSASIQLFAGGSRSVGYLSTIQMTGIAFWRPSTTVTYIAAEYQWYCQRVDGTPCITSGTIPSGISVDLTRKLDGDLTYMLWLTYNSSTISSLHAASDVVYLSVVKVGNMPGISLQVNPSQPNPSAQGFYIRGVVDASSVNTNLQKLTYSFSSLTTCNGASYSALDLTSASTMTGGCNSPMLKINPSSLSPGTAYCIQLQVTDPKYPSTKGSAFTVIRAGNPPSFGTCGLSLPLSNSNLTDTDILVFDCYGWTAESTSLPLTYTWEIANMDISPTTFYRLTRPSASSKLTTSLHAGNYSISVTITDVNGISNSALQIIPILISSSNYAQSFSLLMSIDLLEFSNTTLEQQYVAGLQTNLQAIMSDFNQTENYNAALLGISTLSQTVASLSTDYSYNLVADVNAAMETLLSTGIYIDKDTFLLLSDITHMLYSQFKLDDLQRASVSQIMNYCLSNLNFNLQDPRNYLKDSSIDRILSQIEWSQSSQTDAQISQTNWASKYMLALFVLQGRACGETFYEYGGSEYFTCAIGKQDYYSGTIVSQCGFIFNTTKNSNLSTDGCVRMICGKYFNSSRSISISTASNISDVSKSHSEIMFFDSSNNPIIPYQINTILVNLDVPQDFATRHVITSQANMATATFICVWSSFNASLSFWRSNGCTLSAINSSVATCQCTFSNSQGGATVYSVAAINSTNSADSSEPMNLSSTFTTIIAVVLSLVALAVGIVLLFHYKGKEIRSWAKKIWIKIKKRIRKRRKNGVKKDDESRGEEEGDDDNDNESNKGEDGGELKKKSIFASQESLESRSIPPSASSRRKGEIRLSNSFEELSEAENIATQELLKQVKEKDGRREEKSEVGDAGMKGLLSRIGGMLLTSTATTTRTAETAAGVVTKRSSFNARDHESETKWDALEKEDNQGHRLAIPRTINAVSSSTTGAAPKRKIVSQMDDFEVYTLPSVVKKASGGGGGNKQSGAATVSKKPTKQIWPIPM